ncbi:MAG: MnhB domain-containing protein [Actinomycetota bacterium]
MIREHSPVVELGVRAASPLAIMVGVYLLFAGHNNPGGGFAAGLVFGAVVALRTVAGLQRTDLALPLIAGGVIVAGLVAAAPLLWGDLMLDQQVWTVEVPVLGKVKSGTALFFDLGVTAIVIGLVMAVLDGLGAADLAAPPSHHPDGDGDGDRETGSDPVAEVDAG